MNKEHPFVEEHSSSKKEKELVRTVALINFLSDMYALDIGVEPNIVEKIIEYRDKLMKFKSLERRQSGTYIAKLLLQVQHDSKNYKKLEAVVSDALKYIGFEVIDLAKSGEPEGIAKAYKYPTNQRPGSNPSTALYSFSFDAKSSKYENASTGNIKLDGVVEHQKRYKADYSLVIAPGFINGAFITRCIEQKVTAITTRDLGKLLEYTVEFGAIPTTKLRELFSIYDFNVASKWVDDLKEWISNQRNLTVDVFIRALRNLKGQVPDALSAATISLECRRALGITSVVDADVIAVAKGLAILAPDLIAVDGEKIIVNANPEKVAAAVEKQLDNLHSE